MNIFSQRITDSVNQLIKKVFVEQPRLRRVCQLKYIIRETTEPHQSVRIIPSIPMHSLTKLYLCTLPLHSTSALYHFTVAVHFYCTYNILLFTSQSILRFNWTPWGDSRSKLQKKYASQMHIVIFFIN